MRCVDVVMVCRVCISAPVVAFRKRDCDCLPLSPGSCGKFHFLSPCPFPQVIFLSADISQLEYEILEGADCGFHYNAGE